MDVKLFLKPKATKSLGRCYLLTPQHYPHPKGQPMSLGLYIHIPFCRQKCNYCDFYSVGGAKAVPTEYIAALKREIEKNPEYANKSTNK